MTESIYSKLSQIDVKPLVEKKMGLTYLSWAKAWGLVKAVYPDATYKIREFDEYIQTQQGWIATGRKVDYRLTSVGCEVEVTVIIDDQRFTSKLFVMDHKNRTVMRPDYAQINKTQQRCLVKALAYAGLGLNIYAGEDLPSEETVTRQTSQRRSVPTMTTEELQRKAEEKLVNYQGLNIPLLTLYQDAKTDGKGSDTAKALHEISKGDAVIMNLVKQLVKAGV